VPDRGVGAERLRSETAGSVAPLPGIAAPNHAEDWPRSYVLPASDVNVFVQGGVGTVIQRLQQSKIGGLEKPRHRETVQNLRMSQYTFLCNSLDAEKVPDIQFDIIVVSTDRDFQCLKGRQEAFRKMLRNQRDQMHASHGDGGILAFDAYIYLLKAFAATVPEDALSSFQAICLGLFVVKLGLHEQVLSLGLSTAKEPTGLILFECFLRFCGVYFANQWNSNQKMKNYRFSALDLSAGKLAVRSSSGSTPEAYFVTDEVYTLQTRTEERMNVAASMKPKLIHDAAHVALVSKLSVANGELRYG